MGQRRKNPTYRLKLNMVTSVRPDDQRKLNGRSVWALRLSSSETSITDFMERDVLRTSFRNKLI